MRNVPYVKFVDELYPNFDFHRISEYTKENEYTEEVDIIIKKEINMCKKRLDGIMTELFPEK